MSLPPKTLTLETSDGASFEVSEAAAKMFGTIRNMVEDGCTNADRKIRVPMVAGDVFAMMVRWCEKHADKAAEDDDEEGGELKKWDSEFVKDMGQGVLYHLLLGADFLDVAGLVDLLAEKVASMIRGTKVEQIRETFCIENDLPPEQEAEIRRKNAWAFE